MGKVVGWIVVIALIVVAYQSGWFNSIVSYFDASKKQEKVIEEADGSITTIRYRNVFDVITGK